MVKECKICVHKWSYDYQFCAEKVKNNMNTNYIQGVTEMQVKNWTMPIKTIFFFLQEWQKASNRLIFEIIGLKQGD